MSAVKAARAARAAAGRRRVWYVMTSRVGREPRAKKERGTGDARNERADVGIGPYDAQNDRSEETNAEV